MKKIITGIILWVFLGANNNVTAQIDPHFSQYYANPLWLNPALTGVFDGTTRLTLNYKSQWAGVGNGYKTGGLSLDLRPTEKVGLGLNIIDQAAGTAGYNYFAGYLSFGYGIAISGDGYQKLHFGVQGGVINRSFDPSKLQLDNQYNPAVGFDPSIPITESFSATNAVTFDASAGIYYYCADPSKAANFFAGISVAHLTDSKDPFGLDGINSKLPIRYTIHGGVKIKASDFFDITPHLIYIRQQQNQLRAIGAYSEFKLQDDSGLVLGGMYRVNDAAVADVGYNMKSMLIGLSYDFNTSAFKAATSGQGGLELSIRYIFGSSFGNSVVCPSF